MHASAETRRTTTLGRWATGTRINLERAMKLGDEIGGHIVGGHVDGIATIIDITPEGALETLYASTCRSTLPASCAQRIGLPRWDIAHRQRC